MSELITKLDEEKNHQKCLINQLQDEIMQFKQKIDDFCHD